MHVWVRRVEETIELGPACAHALRHRLLADALLPHRLGELPSDHPLYGGGLNLLEQTLILQEAVEGRTTVIESFGGHDKPLSCLRLFALASSRSSAGLVRDFLMK